MLDRLLEKSVVASFASTGPRLRRRLFDWDRLERRSLAGKVVVLSGATSGIGEAAAALFAAQGATLEILARDRTKAMRTVARLRRESGNPRVAATIADLGDLDQVRTAAETLASRHERIDVLAHNAGALFPERRRTADGMDLSVELMVSAPFLLTGLLLERLRGGASAARIDSGGAVTDRTEVDRTAPGRVLTMSSGGMYTEPLAVADLQMEEASYRGTVQYARAKRAQVSLNEAWAARVPANETVFHALHPGWVDTPGITGALPGFSRALSTLGLLRTAREGADTLAWLANDGAALGSSGDFWLDRERRPTHRLARTRESDTAERRARLWCWCEARTGWSFDAVSG